MKNVFLAILTTLLLVSWSVAQKGFKTYSNDRFFYLVEYPADIFKMQAAPTNNDGRTFRSKDGTAEMRVWGQFNALGRNLLEEYEESLKKCGKAQAYKAFRERYFVLSCTVRNRIFYQRTIHRGRTGPEIFFTLTIEYPKSQKRKFDPLVTRISRSFKFDPDADI